MPDINEELGTIEKTGSYYRATLKRMLDHDKESVWSMLTDSGHFKDWLAPGEIELCKGGVAKLNFSDIVIDSIVSECEPPSLLEYSWSSGDEPRRQVRWQLDTIDSGTRLTLVLGLPEDEDVARSCAGWEAHLMMMHAAIEGVPIKFPFERFMATREAYNKLIAE